MESENNNNEVAPEPGLHGPAFEERPKPRWFSTALVISVVFHLGLAASLISLRLGHAEARVQAVRPGVVVAVIRREQRSDSPSPAGPQVEPATIPAPPPASNPAPRFDEVVQPAPAATPGETTVTALRSAPAPTDQTSTTEDAGTIDAVALQQSITSYVNSYKTEQLTTWIDECQRFRNRYFTQDCTQDPNARTQGSYVSANTIIPLLDDDSPLGDLARERYALVVAPRDFSSDPIIKSRNEQLVGPSLDLIALGVWAVRNVLVATDMIVIPIAVPEFTKPTIPADADTQQSEEALVEEFEKTPPLFRSTD